MSLKSTISNKICRLYTNLFQMWMNLIFSQVFHNWNHRLVQQQAHVFPVSLEYCPESICKNRQPKQTIPRTSARIEKKRKLENCTKCTSPARQRCVTPSKAEKCQKANAKFENQRGARIDRCVAGEIIKSNIRTAHQTRRTRENANETEKSNRKQKQNKKRQERSGKKEHTKFASGRASLANSRFDIEVRRRRCRCSSVAFAVHKLNLLATFSDNLIFKWSECEPHRRRIAQQTPLVPTHELERVCVRVQYVGMNAATAATRRIEFANAEQCDSGDARSRRKKRAREVFVFPFSLFFIYFRVFFALFFVRTLKSPCVRFAELRRANQCKCTHTGIA